MYIVDAWDMKHNQNLDAHSNRIKQACFPFVISHGL